MPSARPSRGATSTAPEIGMISTAMPRSAKKRRAVFGWAVATRRPASSSTVGDGSVVRDGGGEPAAAVAEGADPRQVGAGLAQEVESGDAEVGDAVADELDDVVGPDEQDVEVVVLDERDEAPVVLLEDEAGVVEQPEGRLDHPALVRDREAKAAAHRSPATGYGVVPARDAASSLASIAAIAALAVVEPRGDPGDRGGAGAGPARDLGVVEAGVEHPDDRPALGHVAELVERAEVAEEALGLVDRLEAQDRLEQRLDLGSLPVVGHVATIPCVPCPPHRCSVLACYYDIMLTWRWQRRSTSCPRSTCVAVASSGSQAGDFERETAFGDDPVAVAAGFADEGARWIHVVDLDAARTGRPAHDEVIEAHHRRRSGSDSPSRSPAASGPTTPSRRRSPRGAARAVVGTAAIRDPVFAGVMVEVHGPARIAVAIDVRDGRAVGDAWSTGDEGVDADRDHPPSGRRWRRDVRGDRHRPRWPAVRSGPRPLRAPGAARPRRDHRVGRYRDARRHPSRPRGRVSPARSSVGRSTRAGCPCPTPSGQGQL